MDDAWQEPGASRLTDEEHRRLDERVQHVIVLMLENRSFDHVFGFLDHPHPAWDGAVEGDLPNPDSLEAPSRCFGLTPGAEDLTPFDPPHGSASVETQLHRDADGQPQLDGFVAAQARKIAGAEPKPKVRWWLVGPLVGAVIAAAASSLASLSVNGGWDELVPWIGGAALFVALCFGAGLRYELPPGLRGSRLVGPLVIAIVLLGAAGRGAALWTSNRRLAVTWLLIVGLVGIGTALQARHRRRRRAAFARSRAVEWASTVMRCWSPDKIPVLAMLAKAFVLCREWYSSVPGATWPNRNFAHAACSGGSRDIEIGFYEEPTVFDRLSEGWAAEHPDWDAEDESAPVDEAHRAWRVYFHDLPQVVCFKRLFLKRRRGSFVAAKRLLSDIENDRLPQYAFVEPWHSPGPNANSQHPGNNMDPLANDFGAGERLIAAIYHALANHPEVFRKTVFVITYDEHGGFPDRRRPIDAVPPHQGGDRRDRPSLVRRLVSWVVDYRSVDFDFATTGLRVPTVIISPWVVGGDLDDTPYDHASIVASIRRRFVPHLRWLTRRDEAARDFLGLFVGDQTEPLFTPPIIEGFEDATIAYDDADLPIDAAARGPVGGPKGWPRATVDDDLIEQLDALSVQVRERIDDEETREAVPTPRSAFGGSKDDIPTAALLAAWGNSTSNGNPGLDAF